MRRIFSATSAIVFVASLSVVGCGGSAVEDDGAEVAIDEKADGVAKLIGQYQNRTASTDQFRLLDLRSNKTFHSVTQTDPPDLPIAQDGTYVLSKSWSGKTKYIKLKIGDDGSLGRYAWTLSGDTLDTLTLRNPITQEKQTLFKQALGKVGDSCGGFVADVKGCEDGLVCIANGHIPDLPGTCQKLLKKGDACVHGFTGISLGVCEDGTKCTPPASCCDMSSFCK